MSILDAFDALVSEHLQELIEVGTLRYSKTLSPYKERRSLGVTSSVADFEILLWDTGEVEFGYGVDGETHEETVFVTAESELRHLMQRFLEVGRSWKPSVAD